MKNDLGVAIVNLVEFRLRESIKIKSSLYSSVDRDAFILRCANLEILRRKLIIEWGVK